MLALIVVLLLWIVKEVLGIAGLGEPATRALWIIAVIIAILWLVFGYTFIR